MGFNQEGIMPTKQKAMPAKPVLPVKRTVIEAPPRRDADDGMERGEVENLDRVRDILFGSQVRDSERRIGKLEELVTKEMADVREDVRKRLEAIEASVRKEVQSLLERLKAEQAQRGEAIKEVLQELKESAKSFQQRCGELQEQSAEAQKALRQEIADQAKSLRGDMLQARAEGVAELQRTSTELRTRMVDRSALFSSGRLLATCCGLHRGVLPWSKSMS